MNKTNSQNSSPEATPRVLRSSTRWQDLHLYQKSDVLYQLTFIFCDRFLPKYGDRTVDQMVQAARSCKQNIVEGSEDGKTSTEMELKLLNVARASNNELREDYKDFIHTHNLELWVPSHQRFSQMQEFTKQHNQPNDYLPFANQWTNEEFANIALTLCYQVDAMLNSYLKTLETRFVTEGGIKERMYAARTGYRKEQDKMLESLTQENIQLKQQLTESARAYEDLKQRALKAFYDQKAHIEELEKRIKELEPPS